MALGDAAKSRMARSTAEGACALRAAGRTLRDPELRNPDYLAASFIAPGFKATALVKVPLVSRLAPGIFESILPGSLWFELARTHHMDEVLLNEVRDGAGQVVFLGWLSGYGNFTCVRHAARLSTCYAHQSRFLTRNGTRVARGQAIGLVGCTGHCFGPHLHFEVHRGPGWSNQTSTDPIPYLPR